jgi:tRNA-2-methylthio-N6-dimethylallyladenosine synthase
MPKKKVFLITYGCQMNVYDSSRMGDIMVNSGYELTEKLDESDVIIMNTCHIREKASEKVFSELGKLKKYKQKMINEGKYPVIVVAGCVATALGEKIFKRMPIVDIVVGGESYHKINEMVEDVFTRNQKIVAVEFNSKEKFGSLPKKRTVKGVSDSVTIQSGCDKFCSYCVVPYTRGREYSRPVAEVIEEIKYIAELGVREVVLLGENVDNYHGLDGNGECDLAELIYKVNRIDGLERIRYTTSYPSQFADDMILAHRELKKLMPQIHLPAQSGSNKVLKSMNRKYTRELYLELIEKIKKNVPDVALSSDFIVGFAGETEEDFQETLDLVKRVVYASSFSFKYSRRPNTVAYAMPNQVNEKTKRERLNILQEVLNGQQADFNKSFIGKELDILVENILEDRTFFGRSIYAQAVVVENTGNVKIGDIVKIRVKDGNLRTLRGEITL